MNTEDLTQLKEAAGQATPGPWEKSDATGVDDGGEPLYLVCAGEGHSYGLVADTLRIEDAAHIALCSPDRIIGLVEREERLTAALEQIASLECGVFPLPMALIDARNIARSALETKAPEHHG